MEFLPSSPTPTKHKWWVYKRYTNINACTQHSNNKYILKSNMLYELYTYMYEQDKI